MLCQHTATMGKNTPPLPCLLLIGCPCLIADTLSCNVRRTAFINAYRVLYPKMPCFCANICCVCYINLLINLPGPFPQKGTLLDFRKRDIITNL